jgi:hypothetical protein
MLFICIYHIHINIAFYTVEIGFKVEADPALLALAHAVSIAEERHPAANHI